MICEGDSGAEPDRTLILILVTLCIAWIRKVKQAYELCLAADSCLSGGDRFYAAPKIFTLKRGDCAFACAGSTDYFYPIAEHVVRAVELNQPILDRAIDFLDLKHFILDIINKSLFEIKEVCGYDKNNDNGPDFSVLLCGYSWKKKDFYIFCIEFDSHLRKMVAKKVKTTCGQFLGVIGDREYISKVRYSIFKELNGDKFMNMEPLKVLCEYLDNSSITTIGGYPQMVKIYPFMKTLPFGFIHEKASGDKFITYMGRPMLEYETFPYPMYELKTGETKYMKVTTKEFKRTHETTNILAVYKND